MFAHDVLLMLCRIILLSLLLDGTAIGSERQQNDTTRNLDR